MRRSRLDEYLSLWQGEEKKTAGLTPSGSPRLDLDVNPKVPKTWHFGPPPSGWGASLSGLGGYATERRPATWCGGSGHTPGSPRPGFWEVPTRWVQERLRALGKSIALDGVYGPQTASALQSWISSLGAGARTGYEFSVGCGTTWTVLATQLERALASIDVTLLDQERADQAANEAAQVVDVPPPPAASSSGVGYVLPLAALGAGLILLFRR